jgi:hypothetical protein
MKERMKKIYQVPDTQIVQLRLHSHLAERTPGIGGEFNPGSNKSEQGGRETGGSFFDDEELDDGLLNGGPNMFTDWEDKDRL